MEYTHVDGNMANHGGMIRQPNTLGLPPCRTPLCGTARTAGARLARWGFGAIDDKRALDVDLDAPGMHDCVVDLGGAGEGTLYPTHVSLGVDFHAVIVGQVRCYGARRVLLRTPAFPKGMRRVV